MRVPSLRPRAGRPAWRKQRGPWGSSWPSQGPETLAVWPPPSVPPRPPFSKPCQRQRLCLLRWPRPAAPQTAPQHPGRAALPGGVWTEPCVERGGGEGHLRQTPPSMLKPSQAEGLPPHDRSVAASRELRVGGQPPGRQLPGPHWGTASRDAELASAPGSFPPRQLGAALPDQAQGGNLCVGYATRDPPGGLTTQSRQDSPWTSAPLSPSCGVRGGTLRAPSGDALELLSRPPPWCPAGSGAEASRSVRAEN